MNTGSYSDFRKARDIEEAAKSEANRTNNNMAFGFDNYLGWTFFDATDEFGKLAIYELSEVKIICPDIF